MPASENRIGSHCFDMATCIYAKIQDKFIFYFLLIICVIVYFNSDLKIKITKMLS